MSEIRTWMGFDPIVPFETPAFSNVATYLKSKINCGSADDCFILFQIVEFVLHLGKRGYDCAV